VRSALGLTFDEWRDARERRWKGGLEVVLPREGRIRAWLRLTGRGGVRWAELLLHPDEEEMLPLFVDYVMAEAGTYLWIVPDYQEPLGHLLLERGFREVARYSLLVKHLAARVRNPNLAPVEA
jgi:hypothetical protein